MPEEKELRVVVCSETGMCSIVREGTNKIDLLPSEVEELRAAGGDAAAIRKIIAGCSSAFADGLSDEEIELIVQKSSVS